MTCRTCLIHCDTGTLKHSTRWMNHGTVNPRTDTGNPKGQLGGKGECLVKINTFFSDHLTARDPRV